MPPKKKIIESLDEELLKHIASKYGMTLPRASIKIDECIQRTAMIMKVSYSVIYNLIFTEIKSDFEQRPVDKSLIDATMPNVIPTKAIDTAKGVETILIDEGVCDKFDIDQCNSSNSCFYLEPYGCLSKKIEDADIINEDPDKYIENRLGKVADLERMVKIASFLYYNYEGGGIDDNSFDSLEWHLKKKAKLKDRLYEKIGAEPVDKIKTRLQFEMPSLIKVKPGTSECNTFLSQFIGSAFVKPIPCSWSLKLDGVSGMLIYKNGNLVEINTRGTGIIGGNVSYLKDYILSIPQKLKSSAYDDFVIRGEFILQTNVWEKKYKGSYANPRAFVSGKINAGFISPALHDIDFVAYEIMYESLVGDSTDELKRTVPQPSHAFKILEVEGFKVVDNDVIHSPTVFEIMELYKEKRLKSQYRIDGLVLALDKARKPAKRVTPETMYVESPKHTVAFKMALDDQIRSTEIINVEWNISRYGRYVPVAIYKAVYVEGVRLARATAHNARHVQDWNMGKGTKVKVVRSGDVIPQIKDVEVDSKIKPIFPKSYDDGGYEWHWSGSDIILDEIETNKEVLIKRVVHFFETINVPRIGQKTAEKFYEAGMSTPESVVKSSVENFMKIKGIGKKTAESYYHGIRKIMAVTPPDRFIVASTTFKSGLGRKLLKQLFKVIPNILDMTQTQIESYFKAKKVAGLGPSRIKMISEGIPKFREYLDSFAKEDVSKAVSYYAERMKELDKNGRNKLIEGKKFVTTNFMGSKDYELEDYISDNNGEFVSTVTSDVSAIICGTIMSVTKKMTDAAELEVPVLSLQEFCNRFNVPLKKFDKSDTDKNSEED